MSLAAEPQAKDLAVHFSRMVLAILLPSIFLSFCVLAYVVQSPTIQNRLVERAIDPIQTGSTPATPPLAAISGEIPTPAASGYGIDDRGGTSPR